VPLQSLYTQIPHLVQQGFAAAEKKRGVAWRDESHEAEIDFRVVWGKLNCIDAV
jgi:hypothetical protein